MGGVNGAGSQQLTRGKTEGPGRPGSASQFRTVASPMKSPNFSLKNGQVPPTTGQD